MANIWVNKFRKRYGVHPVKLVKTYGNPKNPPGKKRKIINQIEKYSQRVFVTNGERVWRWGKWQKSWPLLWWIDKFDGKYDEIEEKEFNEKENFNFSDSFTFCKELNNE